MASDHRNRGTKDSRCRTGNPGCNPCRRHKDCWRVAEDIRLGTIIEKIRIIYFMKITIFMQLYEEIEILKETKR